MSSADNVRIVKELYEMFGRGDVESMIGALGEDVEWRSYGPESDPFFAAYRGRDGVRQFFGIAAENLEFHRFEAREFIAEGDRVVVLGEAHWTGRATGRTVQDEWVHILTVRDGLVVSMREFSDTATFVEAVRGRAAAAV